ncbi:MAG: hypothetical protein KAR05_10875 [Candidatus Omnitrophica bacterium]|nr:hypothetical protein [Candidatus Omnitrophota bacterium]
MRTINKKLKRDLSALLAVCLFLVQPLSMGSVRAQGITSPTGILNLPAPGTMVGLTPAYNPAMIRGITIYPDTIRSSLISSLMPGMIILRVMPLRMNQPNSSNISWPL